MIEEKTINHVMQIEELHPDSMILWPSADDYWNAFERSAYILAKYFPYAQCHKEIVDGSEYIVGRVKLAECNVSVNAEYCVIPISKSIKQIGEDLFTMWKASFRNE